MQYELFTDADFQQTTPFTDRSVCLLGSFARPMKQLRERLLALGADIKPSLSNRTHYVIIGRDVPADKQEKLDEMRFNGYQPRCLTEMELNQIFEGHYAGYEVPEKLEKDLHLTLQHFLSANASFRPESGSLYTHELYVAPDTEQSQASLYQALGNRGIYANPYIDDTTDLIIISDSSLQHLKDGTTDDVLRYIERSYNESRSPAFRMQMATESQLQEFIDLPTP